MAAKPPDNTDQKSGSPARFKGHPRGVTNLRERTLARVFRAANRAGNVSWIDIMPDGSIRVVPAGHTLRTTNTDHNPWDEVHAADKERPT